MGLLDEKTGDLISFWKSKSPITDRVGAGDNAKIWPGLAKEKQPLPFITFNSAPGSSSEVCLDGPAGHGVTNIHVYAYGASPSKADELATVIKQQTETVASQMMGSTWVDNVRITSPIDQGVDQPKDGSDNKRYWSRVVLLIAHAEPAQIT